MASCHTSQSCQFLSEQSRATISSEWKLPGRLNKYHVCDEPANKQTQMCKVNVWPHINQPWPWGWLATLTRTLNPNSPQINRPVHVPTLQATPASNGPPCLRPQEAKSPSTQSERIIKESGTCCWSHRAFSGAFHLQPGPPLAGLSLELLGSTFACSMFGSGLPLPPPTHAPRLAEQQERDGDCIRVLLGLSGLTMAHFWWLAATYTQPPTELLVSVLVLCNFKLFLAWILICKVQYMKKKITVFKPFNIESAYSKTILKSPWKALNLRLAKA